MIKNTKLKIVIEYCIIAFGAAIMAIGIGIFLVDAPDLSGGKLSKNKSLFFNKLRM